MVVSHLYTLLDSFVQIVYKPMSIGFHVLGNSTFHGLIVFYDKRNILLIGQVKSFHRVSLVVFFSIYYPTNKFPIVITNSYQ